MNRQFRNNRGGRNVYQEIQLKFFFHRHQRKTLKLLKLNSGDEKTFLANENKEMEKKEFNSNQFNQTRVFG